LTIIYYEKMLLLKEVIKLKSALLSGLLTLVILLSVVRIPIGNPSPCVKLGGGGVTCCPTDLTAVCPTAK
jgi:hypothetical protein